EPGPEEPPSLPKEVKVKPAVPPVVTIRKAEPAEPREDGNLTIYLTGKQAGDSKLRYEYRLRPGAAWQPAPEGRVRLTKLKSGKLTLEVRAVDPRDRASKVITRTWTVKERPKPKPAVLVTLKEGDTFYQEVVITRLSSYRFLGTELKQNTQYGFLSRFKVEKKHADGSMVVSQKVETAR